MGPAAGPGRGLAAFGGWIRAGKKRELRTDRFRLSPPPNIIFQHPLINKLIKFPAQDISITGFSVEEEERKTPT